MDLVLYRLVDMDFSGMFSDPHCRYMQGGTWFYTDWWTWISVGCSQILTVYIQGLQVDLVLYRLVDMDFSGMFSDPHCIYTRPTGRPGFIQIGGHGFQWDVLRSSLYVCKVDLVLIRLVDMDFNGMFSDPHCIYARWTCFYPD